MQKGKILKSNKDKTKMNISFWSLGIGKNGQGEEKRRREEEEEEEEER